MTGLDEPRTIGGFSFYGPQYARFESDLAAAMRREVYGEDIGPQGWRTAAEQAEIADLVLSGPDRGVLDVVCGAGGPSLALVEHTRCRLTGLDAEAAGIAHAEQQATARGLADRATFAIFDCGGRLPFEDASFDAVLCVDAVCHLPDRLATVREWARLLRKGGRLLFTDPAVLTGAAARTELDVRGSTGFFLVVPPGLNEEAIAAADLTPLRREDRTAATAEIAARWQAVRLRHAEVLRREEGEEWFGRRQRFLAVDQMNVDLTGMN